jgi:hypothetical protein
MALLDTCGNWGPWPFVVAVALVVYLVTGEVIRRLRNRRAPTLFIEPLSNTPVKPRRAINGAYDLAFRLGTLTVSLVALGLAGVTVGDLLDTGDMNIVAATVSGLAVFGFYWGGLYLLYLPRWLLGWGRKPVGRGHLMLRFLPRKNKRLGGFSMGFVNPVMEEIVFRLILVHFVGCWLDSMFVGFLVGATATMAAHLYQGVRALPGHFLFASIATLLMYSPVGLVGAIAFHAAADMTAINNARQSMLDWRRLVLVNRKQDAAASAKSEKQEPKTEAQTSA